MKNTRYIIKVTATATSDNPNFAGEVKTYYFGKGQFLISDKAEPMDALSKYLLTATAIIVGVMPLRQINSGIILLTLSIGVM